MAGSSLFTLIDDIASLLDDVALLTKTATKKTAGVLGDDLALNAQQVAGVSADRELPVVWAVFVGSARNKLIIVPAALALSVWAAPLIPYILMLGGAFLCFEGCEKLVHSFLHRKGHHPEGEPSRSERLQALADPNVDVVALEKEKIRGAIRTDIILSAEIIVITLGTVSEEPFGKQVAVLSLIAVLMTLGVYGFVAGIVKLDDAGLALTRRPSVAAQGIGRAILAAAPYLMKTLSIAGTVAMFLVGGGILVHGIGPLHHLVEEWQHAAGSLGWLIAMLMEGLVGLLAGGVLVAIVTVVQRLRGKSH